MVDRNDALLRELDDEIRAERYRKLWEKYWQVIVGTIVAIPLAAVLWQVYDARSRSIAESAGARFETARRLAAENKPAEAAKTFSEIVTDGPAGYATLARLQTAATTVKGEKPADAVPIYEAIASDNAAPPALRDFARLQAASLRLESADWTEIQNRLNPLTDEKNAFRSMARELLGLAALKAGKPDDARRAFLLVIGDAKTSQGQKERVQSHLAGVAAADLAKPPAAAPAAGAPAKP